MLFICFLLQNNLLFVVSFIEVFSVGERKKYNKINDYFLIQSLSPTFIIRTLTIQYHHLHAQHGLRDMHSYIHFFCKNTTTFTVFVCFLDWLALHFNLVVFIFNNWMEFLGTILTNCKSEVMGISPKVFSKCAYRNLF